MNREHKAKVLLLDDEKFLLNIYKVSFEKHGYEVSIFHDVDGALSALRSGFSPDVILFDITMPDSRSGYEFLESIHREKLARHSLKLALTNEGQDGPQRRLQELGADGHLLKAKYLPAELVAKINELLKHKKGILGNTKHF
jgi:CheY-like chemotaxis protein